jgi:hypothetical protein
MSEYGLPEALESGRCVNRDTTAGASASKDLQGVIE